MDEQFASWLAVHADALDTDASLADFLLPKLGASGLLKVGDRNPDGGTCAAPSIAVGSVAALAEYSLSTAFVFWAQRAFIECLLHSPNRELAQRLLPLLARGVLAGAPGLSNAMRSASGLDSLHTSFVPEPAGARLNGHVPWASNLRTQGFAVLVAAGDAGSGKASVFAVPHDAAGVARGPDLDLLGLRATNTAAVRLNDVVLDDSWLVHPDAKAFLPKVRPVFLGLQCGLGLGLARACLRRARELLGQSASILLPELRALERSLGTYWQELSEGLDSGRLADRRHELLALRIRMVELATAAAQLELQASGGRAYLAGRDNGFARRWREAAFLPIVTPSMVQLKTELSRMGANQPNLA